MGCVSSNLLNQDEEFSQLGSSALGHHIVSLTSTTYGLLTLDPQQPPPQTTTTPPRFTLGSIFHGSLSEAKLIRSEPEVINSWELMSGLDNDSFRFSPLIKHDKENSNPNTKTRIQFGSGVFESPRDQSFKNVDGKERSVDGFDRSCPPNGENRVVIYTTTLRGIRSTFEACNSIRAVLEGFGVAICERDVSMDRGFREELRMLMEGRDRESMVPPRVFVKGRYIGGAQEVMRLVEEGLMAEVLEGLPRKLGKSVCDGCGDAKFLPCFSCNGSCKKVMAVKEEGGQKQQQGRSVVVRCCECNENGLVLCPICS